MFKKFIKGFFKVCCGIVISIFAFVGMVDLLAIGTFLLPEKSADEQYLEASEWSCYSSEFVTVKYDYYDSLVKELMEKYELVALDYSFNIIHALHPAMFLNVYGNNFTLKIEFQNCESDKTSYATIRVQLLCFVPETDGPVSYESHSQSVNFANELVRTLAYDSDPYGKENYFEDMFKNNEHQIFFHHDSEIGNVGYIIHYDNEFSADEYRGEYNAEYLNATRYMFIGIMKGN